MDDVFVVLVSYHSMFIGDSDISNVLSVSHSEETAWTSIEKDINDLFTKNNFRNLCISIYPELRLIRVITTPMCCGCDSTNVIYTHRDYRILRRKMTN